MIADSFVFSQAFYERFGANRLFHQLAHDIVFKMPGLRTLVQRWGTVPASPENMRRVMARTGTPGAIRSVSASSGVGIRAPTDSSTGTSGSTRCK